ncbi:site-specific integrase [Saccharopolyspora elongata]|uniref:Site-specific integrase n=1 Tax=Saccharopolyspora elongata TaxID=2530387 RepID=A0A4R4YUL4_9PSEU|nr:site-specific integrase [Saccharopolyspora elongata]
MGRPPLQIGTRGKINTTRLDDVAWRARTRFRAFDGKTRLVERSGQTEKRAVERLESAIEQLQKSRTRLTVDFKFRDVAEVWLGKVAQRRAEMTRDTYEQTLKSVVLDRIGDLRLREISIPDLEEFFEKLEADGYSAGYRRSVRTTVRGTLQVAVRHGLLHSNPMREVSPIEGRPRKVRALTTEERRRLSPRRRGVGCSWAWTGSSSRAATPVGRISRTSSGSSLGPAAASAKPWRCGGRMSISPTSPWSLMARKFRHAQSGSTATSSTSRARGWSGTAARRRTPSAWLPCPSSSSRC